MSNREIRAMLRGARKAGLIDGWYFYGSPANLRWAVSAQGRAPVHDHAGIVSYCDMLREGGIEPAYITA